ncbi:MAG: DUF262 domain-containing protein [Phycicoccus sp.]|nr:DUF262 domain-containing protein [Phycicoccus sp.]
MPEDDAVDVTDSQLLSDDELAELEEADPKAHQVVYAGQDFDVEGLVRRLDRRDILIPRFGHADEDIVTPGFQRSFVWKRPQMDRFIESMLLGYPIPGILLVRQQDKRYLVLDGQQRLRTLQHFYSGIHGDRVFDLKNVSEEFRGLSYSTLTPAQKRALDNTYLQATILDTDGSAESLDAIYQIFERLNSGGTQLTPHEIRVALFAGGLIDLLHELNTHPAWRSLYGAPSPRLRDQELVLRILALYCMHDIYTRPLKGFLNHFANVHRDASDEQVKKAAELFKRSSDLLAKAVGRDALRRRSKQINAAQTDAMFVGLMTALETRDLVDRQVLAAFQNLQSSMAFDKATITGTSDEEVVNARIEASVTAFSAA